MLSKEVWQWIHYNYGDELGLTSSDDDYISPPCLDELPEKLKEEIINIKVNMHACPVHVHVNFKIYFFRLSELLIVIY